MLAAVHPIFGIGLPPWWRWQAQMPPGVMLFLPAMIICLWLPQRLILPWLLFTSLLIIPFTWGLPFTAAILGGVLLTYVLYSRAQRTRPRTKPAQFLLLAGWGVLHAVYFSLFFLPITFLERSHPLDIMIFCGPGFILLRSIHLLTDACTGRQRDRLNFANFLLYMIFAPTYRLGPFIPASDLTAQITTCKQRQDGQSIRFGLFRIAIGLGQLLIIDIIIDEVYFEAFERHSFLFIPRFFDPELDIAPAWQLLGIYLYAFRLLLGYEGYAHIVLGMCWLAGIRVIDTFHWPYFSPNIQAFWQRWNISVGLYLRQYIFLPLYRSMPRAALLCVTLTFIYSAAWHAPMYSTMIAALWVGLGFAAFGGWQRLSSYLCRTSATADRLGTFLNRRGIAAAIGMVLTFHHFCVLLMIALDYRYCGYFVFRRLLSPVLG